MKTRSVLERGLVLGAGSKRRAAAPLSRFGGRQHRCYVTTTATATLRFTLIGPPGAGKGTQCAKIKRDFGIDAISTGDLLRAELQAGSDLGKAAKDLIDRGELVSDDLMLGIVRTALSSRSANVQESWILDGHPRTPNQAQQLHTLLEELGTPLSFAMFLQVDKKVIADRLKDRWVHGPSGRTYNLQYNPPKVPGHDDVTGEPLIQRDDDKPETVLARLETFENATKPVLDFYKERDMLVVIPSPNSDVGYEHIRKELFNRINSAKEGSHL
ncbi:Adenylate kinase 2 [Balamuthia mandrillaris]